MICHSDAQAVGRRYIALADSTWTDRILDDGSGPTYTEPVVLFVYARTARVARPLAVRAWRRRARLPFGARGYMKYSFDRPDFLSDPGANPFRAVRIEREPEPESSEEPA